MYLLCKQQQDIYDMEKFSGGSISSICGSMIIKGTESEENISEAINNIIKSNDILRIRIHEENNKTFQDFEDFKTQDFEVLYFEDKNRLDIFAERFSKKPMDISKKLYDIKIIILPDRYGVIVKMHHIISDAWSFSLFGTQFYNFLKGKKSETFSYKNHIENESKYLNSKRYAKDRSYFFEQFKKCDGATFLNEKNIKALNAARKTFTVNKEQTAKLKRFTELNNSSVFSVFTTALSVLFNRTKMNTERFYIGTAVLNRTSYEDKQTMGMYINTVPMLIELDNESDFLNNLKKVESTVFSVLRHQRFNYDDILKEIRKEYEFSGRLYDVIISYQNASIVGDDFETKWYSNGVQNESLQIHIDDRDRTGVYKIHYDYQTEKFKEKDIEKFHTHFMNLLFDGIENSEKKIINLELLTEGEKNTLLCKFNDTSVTYNKNKCIHKLFEEQVTLNSSSTAVVAVDKTLTYKELNEEANNIANILKLEEIEKGDVVAIKLKRRSYIYPAIIGALKVGAIYMMIDPSYPDERIEYMKKKSNAKYCISETNIQNLLKGNNVLDINVTTDIDDCFCILHTSGSTGHPKLSMLKHRGILNFFYANDVFWKNVDTVVSTTIVTFDAFIIESIMSLAKGKKIILADELAIYNQHKFSTLFEYSSNNMIFSTPTKLENYFNISNDKKYFSKIKSFIIGGEVFKENLLTSIYKYSPNSNVYNIYGPTETTICVTNCKLEKNSMITLGKPISNIQIYITDKAMNLMPIGSVGELCISGDGVGLGYINNPEFTVEKFIDNPFGKGKLYKTGDLAYWREDGNIVYVGRNDFQVKIRGLRIELGEIENALVGVEGIEQAIVVVRKNSEGRQFICAFYTGRKKEIKEIRESISKVLPKYMLPHIYNNIDSFPLTTSGKINRNLLPKIDLENIVTNVKYIAPKTDLQKAICKLEEEILQTSHIGLTDDFFDMGGDSLTAIEFVSRAHHDGIFFELQNIFDYPSVEKLCECIENRDKKDIEVNEADFVKVDEVLSNNDTVPQNIPGKKDLGNILLTGATGFLGIHILADFLENDQGMAYCLVRGKTEEASQKRLNELLHFYFADKYTLNKRIKVISGDLQQEYFGLEVKDYNSLLFEVDTVINAAACVKHYGSYKYFYDVNVSTVKRLINFTKKADAKLIHISTLSVSGSGFSNDTYSFENKAKKIFSERTLYIGQPLDNVYARSKFEAEKLVLESIADGLKANVMRMGNLTNRVLDGGFQKNYDSNAFLKRLLAILELGIVPEYLMDLNMEFTPIDEAANAIMTIVRQFSENKTVFHINNNKTLDFNCMIKYLMKLGIELKVVSKEEFEKALRNSSKQKESEHIFETFINDMDKNEQLNYDSNIRFENSFTLNYLKKLGFEWAEVDFEYIRKYIEYFRKIGVIN